MKTKLIQIGAIVLLLNLSLSSIASAIVINGVPQEDTYVTNPNQYYTETTTSSGNSTFNVTAGANTNGVSGTTGGGSSSSSLTPQYVNGRWSEGTLQSYLGSFHIGVDSAAKVYGLGNFAITGVVAMKKTVDYYTKAMRGLDRDLSDITIIRGSETYGIDSPSLDVDANDNLDYFIRHMATDRGNRLYQLGDDYFFDQNDFWHVVFGPSNGTFIKNSINFFGIVRDNFNVAHPAITDSNVPGSVNFSRNLTIGYNGQDVNDMQKLLNTDPYTVLATAGLGSAGQESNYFGALSKAAVVRWQFKYNEILDAAGITAPTGFFGPFTRASVTSYWHYLITLKTTPNQRALQYPTPTKPLEDVPLNVNVNTNPNGTPSSNATTTVTIGVDQPSVQNTTPNAPVYPGYDQDPGAWYLNNTPAFYDPRGSYTTDPNSTLFADQSAIPFNQNQNDQNSQSGQQSGQGSNQSFLGQIRSLLGMFAGQALGGGSNGGILGNLFGGGGAGINFGGHNGYTKIIPLQPPCTCPISMAKAYVQNDNRAFNNSSGPVNLLSISIAVKGGPIAPGQCMIGKYLPFPPDATTAWATKWCVDMDPTAAAEGRDPCNPGIPTTMPISGHLIPEQTSSQANTCSGF